MVYLDCTLMDPHVLWGFNTVKHWLLLLDCRRSTTITVHCHHGLRMLHSLTTSSLQFMAPMLGGPVKHTCNRFVVDSSQLNFIRLLYVWIIPINFEADFETCPNNDKIVDPQSHLHIPLNGASLKDVFTECTLEFFTFLRGYGVGTRVWSPLIYFLRRIYL